MSRPARRAVVVDMPGRRQFPACGGVGHRATAGQQIGQAAGVPVRRARRPGAESQPTPVRSASRAAARRPPGWCQPLTDQDHRTGRQRSSHPSSAAFAPARSISPGPPSSPAAGSERRDRHHPFSPCLRTALRSRRKTIGDSSSGSNRDSTTTGALQVGVGRSWRVAARAARNWASSPSAAGRKSMSLVQHNSGELRHTRGRPRGDPPADQHAGPGPAADRPRTATRRPPATTPGAAVGSRGPTGW